MNFSTFGECDLGDLPLFLNQETWYITLEGVPVTVARGAPDGVLFTSSAPCWERFTAEVLCILSWSFWLTRKTKPNWTVLSFKTSAMQSLRCLLSSQLGQLNTVIFWILLISLLRLGANRSCLKRENTNCKNWSAAEWKCVDLEHFKHSRGGTTTARISLK